VLDLGGFAGSARTTITLGMVLHMSAKWTDADVGDQSGRVAIVTGSNSGLGFDTARVLAEHGATVVLAVRDTEKGAAAASRIKRTAPDADVTVQPLDLGSLDSVRAAAADVNAAHPRIDLLINNAGVMYTPTRQLTADGFEQQFGTNHLGHFALTGLLFDNLTSVPNSRIVTVSSVGHRIMAQIHFDDLQWERTKYNRVAAYGQSKLANLLFTYALQRRLAARDAFTIALAAHPGFSDTELMRHLPDFSRPIVSLVAQNAAKGALPTLRAATDPSATGGQYYGPDGLGGAGGHPKVVASSKQSHDTALQERLWSVSEQLTGVTYPG
jgi:NAD(P)-dependent dehydrogenase (short-subunit alcohol dehydrogenase family)